MRPPDHVLKSAPKPGNDEHEILPKATEANSKKFGNNSGGAPEEDDFFIFDQPRAGLVSRRQQMEFASCLRCQTPLTEEERADERHVPGKSCAYCHEPPAGQAALNIARRHEAIRRVFTPLPGSRPSDNYKCINIPEDCDGKTLLEALGCMVRNVTRAEWEAECARGLIVNLDQEVVDATRPVRAGERFWHLFPKVTEPDVNGSVEILHEDEALIVLNKPAPLPMHAGGRFYRNTLTHLLHEVYHPQRPHPAHRLDANTTGVVLVTRTPHFAGRLQPQFARGQVEKNYLVRVQGQPPEDVFSCDAPISAASGELGSRTVDLEGGQAARTEFRVRQRLDDGTALLEARPLTGRTNQIRVHLWHLGYPVCGDPVYLPGHQLGDTQTLSLDAPPLCLHAWRVKFLHPLSQQPMEFTAPPPSWAGMGV